MLDILLFNWGWDNFLLEHNIYIYNICIDFHAVNQFDNIIKY